MPGSEERGAILRIGWRGWTQGPNSCGIVPGVSGVVRAQHCAAAKAIVGRRRTSVTRHEYDGKEGAWQRVEIHGPL